MNIFKYHTNYLRAITISFVLVSAFCIFSLSQAQEVQWKRKLLGAGYTVARNPRKTNTIIAENNSLGLSVSRNKGKTWEEIGTTGLNNIREIIIHPNDTLTIFAASTAGLKKSVDGGSTWIEPLSGVAIVGKSIAYVPRYPDTMFAGNYTNGEIFISTNRGDDWVSLGTVAPHLTVLTIGGDSLNTLFAGTLSGEIFKSSDNGGTWLNVSSISGGYISSLAVAGSQSDSLVVYAGVQGSGSNRGVWKSTNAGTTWAQTSLTNIAIASLDIDKSNPRNVLAGTLNQVQSTIYKTVDGGVTWNPIPAELPPSASITEVSSDWRTSPEIYLSTTVGSFNGIYRLATSTASMQCLVKDDASNDTVRNGFARVYAGGDSLTADTVSLAAGDGKFHLTLFDDDSLQQWHSHIESFPYVIKNTSLSFVQDSTLAITIFLKRLPMGHISGAVYDTVSGEPIATQIKVTANTINGPKIYTVSNNTFGEFQFDSLYISYPPIISYTQMDVVPTVLPFINKVITPVELTTVGIDTTVLVAKADVLLVGGDTLNYFSYFTTAFHDLGLSAYRWNTAQRGPAPFNAGRSFLKNIVVYFSGSRQTPLSPAEIFSMKSYLTSGGNLFLTGQNIIEQNDTSFLFNDYIGLAFGGNTSSTNCAGIDSGGIFGALRFSTVGSGANNQTSRDNLFITDSTHIRAIVGYGSNASLGIAGVRADGIGNPKSKVIFFGFGFEAIGNANSRKAVLSKILAYFNDTTNVSVQEGLKGLLPAKTVLRQNYPNPFNPSTVIRYSLPVNSIVSLSVFNILGQQVATLLNNQSVESGEHEVKFNASTLSTGIYFYRLNVNNGAFVETRKLVLMK